MTPTVRIALRFLTAKKRSMTMSLACIVLGVGLFVVTQATTGGFESFFVRTILGTNGAILVQDRVQDTMRSLAAAGKGQAVRIRPKEGARYKEGVEYPGLLREGLMRFGGVTGVSEVIRGGVTVRSSFREQTGQALGIEIANHLRVSDLGSHIVEGRIDTFGAQRAGALVGREMADRLQLHVGDPIQLQPATVGGRSGRFRVSAIYQTGVSDIDRSWVYVSMGEARALFGRPTGATYLQVNIADKDRAREVAQRMTDVLQHSAAAWQDREKSWLGVFRVLRIASGITVSIFTLIAALAMFSTLAMVVMDKTKDIAILRSMGYTRRDITRIFVWQAAIVLGIGLLGGCLLGAAVTAAVSRIPLPIAGIFTTHRLLVEWSAWHYVEACSTAVVMVMVASLVPARRAARLEPGDIIRGTAQ